MEHCSIAAARARVAQRKGRLATYGNPQASLRALNRPQTSIYNAASGEPTVTAVKLTTEQYAALCQAVGLDPENITVSTMVARILEHLVAAEGEGGDPQELHAQAAEGAHARAEADRLRKELTEIKAEALITNEGIKAGRLLGWQRDAWMRMAKQDYANTRKELLAMPQAVNLKERGYAGTTNTTTKNNPKWF